MKIQCPHCDKPTELTFQVDWKDFACPHCNTLYKKDETGQPKQARSFSPAPTPLALYVGQQGVLEEVLWEVGGICIKKPLGELDGWREYTLYSKSGEVRFLSEYNGHWILAKEIEHHSFVFDAGHECFYEDEMYPIFHDTTYQTEYAAGIFDHPVPDEGRAKDFARPPRALLLEQEGTKTYAFDARHLSEKELKAAFPEIEMPRRIGQGMLQPFHFNVTELWLVSLGVGGLLILCQLVLGGLFPSYQVLQGYVPLPDSVATVQHLTPSFTCTGLRAPLKVSLSAPVDNSWASVDFCLVNEDNKEERYGSVEVAYYHGVDQGESWSEGTSRPSIKICGVPPGRYHLLMEVSKQPNALGVNTLHYTVTGGAPTMGNLFWALGLLLVVGTVAYIWQAHFHQQRWMNSDFPPETEDED